MLPVVWDLDGTIVDTREANLRAYHSLGVTPPENFDHIHWTTWTDPDTHARKGAIIDSFLKKFSKPGPCFNLYQEVGGAILTMASTPVLEAIRDVLRDDYNVYQVSSVEEKVTMLGSVNTHGLYIDDSLEAVRRVQQETRWISLTAQFASSLPLERVVALRSGDIQTRLM